MTHLPRLRQWLVLAAAGGVWQLWALWYDSPFFPPPLEIAARMHELWFSGPPSHLWLTVAAADNILPSLLRVLAGLSLAAAVAIPLGIGLGRSPALSAYLAPVLHFVRSIPVVTAAPVFVALLSVGPQMEVTAIVAGTWPPLLLTAAAGAAGISPARLETAAVFRLSRWDRLTKLIIPSALPQIFTGVRVSLSLALVLMVVAEAIGVTSGIGYQMTAASDNFDLTELWSILVLLGIIGWSLNAVADAVDRRLLRWHHATVQSRR